MRTFVVCMFLVCSRSLFILPYTAREDKMLVTVILLLIGFVLLVKGSDVFVDGSSSLARLLGIPAVIVGLTIVSMGTSAPEAAVSITAGIKGSNEIALANLVGSNTFNMLVVAGVSAVIAPFAVDRMVIKRDFPVCLGIMALVTFMCIDGTVSRSDGLILFAAFLTYITCLVLKAVRDRAAVENGSEEKPMSPFKSIVFIAIGIAAVIFGGQLVVNSAKIIAAAFGMSENLIGLTIVAIGTSLPELVTSIVAARKGQSEIAIGNVVGSNIFNLAFILGLSSSVTSIAVIPDAFIDTCIMLGATAIGYIMCICGKKLTRMNGLMFTAMYIAYTAYLIVR